MTLGEKLTKLRKNSNYTQEQLADLLDVSRQSVSKWESDIAYPETDKLIRLGKLYGCSLDYLLKEEEENAETPARSTPIDWKSVYFERKSRKTVCGLPLWHINIGLGRTAKGVFAIGLCAKGVVSLGVFSLGVFSFGALALGLFALGAFALGGIAAGSIAAGVFAFGAICVGLVAAGALAVGLFSAGALSIGRYLAIGDTARAAIAIGKSEALGTVFAADAVSAENRAEIFALLDSTVPAVFAWLKNLIKLFL